MRITRENRVKLLRNIGQYLIDHADNLFPLEEPYPTTQNIIISMKPDEEVPQITFYSQYKARDTLKNIEWSPE